MHILNASFSLYVQLLLLMITLKIHRCSLPQMPIVIYIPTAYTLPYTYNKNEKHNAEIFDFDDLFFSSYMYIPILM